MRLPRPLVAVLGAALALAPLAGCRSAEPSAAGTSVVAAFYPLAYAASQVAGDSATVTSLTPPGVEPHDLELSASQVAEIADADLVLYVKGFQPAVDQAVEQQAADRAIDVSAGLPLINADGGADPHVWLDPSNMVVIGNAIAARLAELDPNSAETVQANDSTFGRSMSTLGDEFRTGLANCRSHDLVVSHEAFAYLAKAVGMQQVGISGLSPDAEPSPARMREVADLVTAKGIDTIYYESLVDPKVAQTIASETGASTAMLDPLEGLTEANANGDYASVMRQNLATLRTGQGCS